MRMETTRQHNMTKLSVSLPGLAQTPHALLETEVLPRTQPDLQALAEAEGLMMRPGHGRASTRVCSTTRSSRMAW